VNVDYIACVRNGSNSVIDTFLVVFCVKYVISLITRNNDLECGCCSVEDIALLANKIPTIFLNESVSRSTLDLAASFSRYER
jgi:hypothetical protein